MARGAHSHLPQGRMGKEGGGGVVFTYCTGMMDGAGELEDGGVHESIHLKSRLLS